MIIALYSVCGPTDCNGFFVNVYPAAFYLYYTLNFLEIFPVIGGETICEYLICGFLFSFY